MISKPKMRFSKKSVGFTPHLALKNRTGFTQSRFFFVVIFSKKRKADEHEDTTNKTKEET